MDGNYWEAQADMWHQNYKDAADEIERLRGQVEFEKKCREDAFDELKKQDAEIERLREALRLERQLKDDALRAFNEARAALKGKKP